MVTTANGIVSLKKAQTLPSRTLSQNGGSYNGPLSPLQPLSPAPSLRDVQADAEGSQFPLTNIDNPNAIAQELSNLQALRRMSMDVGNHMDPDLPPFQGLSLLAMPSIAPTGEDDEGDISRLLWVPAKVHPELAPDQFKNFLENRVQSMKRRSGESTLSVDGLQRNNSGSLRRKKSMLSRQVDNAGGRGADGFLDGAEALVHKKSRSQTNAPELSLNELVKDPSKVVQKLTQDTQRHADVGGAEGTGMEDDMPILPVAPGMGLRRSTRTTYRKGGSLRAGDRVPFSKRVAARQAERESEEASQRPSSSSELEAPRGHTLQRIQSEPVAENYSRPTRSVRRQQAFQRDPSSPVSSPVEGMTDSGETTPVTPSQLSQQVTFSRPSTSPEPRPTAPIPTIVASPPDEDDEPQNAQLPRPFPQRSSSQRATAPDLTTQATSTMGDEPPPRSGKRPSLGRPIYTSPAAAPVGAGNQTPSPSQQLNQTLNDMAQHPSPLPGGGTSRTDALTFIPTLSADDRKTDRKSKDDGESSKLTSWKWFKSDDKKDKKKDKDESGKKSRVRSSGEKSQDKPHDGARLDVLSSFDSALAKGRESLLLDRESIDNKLHEERKKESNKKTENKKEKDGFFGSIFGGSRKKEGKDGAGARGKQRALSPEPPARPLRPDLDYPYTRFPIVEERAIYRMAHMKLANPRRDLRSQVLLSNFMYSYLAKVQAMHPQLNVPLSPQQKRQEEERRRREQEEQQQQQQQQQQHMDAQGQRQDDDPQDSIDQYNFDYHRVRRPAPVSARYTDSTLTHQGQSANQYGDANQEGTVDYIDDAQIFEYDHGGQGGESPDHHTGGYANHGDQAQQGRSRNYYDYEQSDDKRRDNNEMW